MKKIERKIFKIPCTKATIVIEDHIVNPRLHITEPFNEGMIIGSIEDKDLFRLTRYLMKVLVIKEKYL
jgi:hypothetical protein